MPKQPRDRSARKARIRLEIEEFRNIEGAIVEEREAASRLMGATPHGTIDGTVGMSVKAVAAARARWLVTLVLVSTVACSSKASPQQDRKAVPAMAQDDAEIKQLVTDLDQKADPLHGDITPSVRKLGAMGERAIPYLQEPLSSSDENRRLHAQRALEGILQNRFGFVAGKGWTQPDGESKFVELWKRNGSYAYDAPDDQRQKAVSAWMAWHQQQAGN